MRVLAAFVASIFSILGAFAQTPAAPQQHFGYRTPGYSSGRVAVASRQTPMLFFLGGSRSDSCLLGATLPTGEFLWRYKFKFTSAGRSEQIHQLYQDRDGNLIGLGWSAGRRARKPIQFVFKFNLVSRQIEWAHRLDTLQRWASIAELNEGYALFGRAYPSLRTDRSNACLLRLDRTTGQPAAEMETFQNGRSESFREAIADSNGIWAVGGCTEGPLRAQFRPMVARFSLDGQLLWARQYLIPTLEIARAEAIAAVPSARGVTALAWGPHGSTHPFYGSVGLFEVDTSGELRWATRLDVDTAKLYKFAVSDLAGDARGYVIAGRMEYRPARSKKLTERGERGVLIQMDLNGGLAGAAEMWTPLKSICAQDGWVWGTGELDRTLWWAGFPQSLRTRLFDGGESVRLAQMNLFARPYPFPQGHRLSMKTKRLKTISSPLPSPQVHLHEDKLGSSNSPMRYTSTSFKYQKAGISVGYWSLRGSIFGIPITYWRF